MKYAERSAPLTGASLSGESRALIRTILLLNAVHHTAREVIPIDLPFIGAEVDDAIVVVENVERIITEEGLSPREATAKSMDEITSALIGFGLVLSAVFGPMAFLGGSTGVIYRQFSVTIIASMLLPVVVALILTPVLCATFLRVKTEGQKIAAIASALKARPLARLGQLPLHPSTRELLRELQAAEGVELGADALERQPNCAAFQGGGVLALPCDPGIGHVGRDRGTVGQ